MSGNDNSANVLNDIFGTFAKKNTNTFVKNQIDERKSVKINKFLILFRVLIVFTL